jgi:hypothetical protein
VTHAMLAVADAIRERGESPQSKTSEKTMRELIDEVLNKFNRALIKEITRER